MAEEGEGWTDKRETARKKKEEFVNMKKKQSTEALLDNWRDSRSDRERERERERESLKACLLVRMRTALCHTCLRPQQLVNKVKGEKIMRQNSQTIKIQKY